MLGYASGGWIAAALGWRLAFGVIGVAGLALAPLVLLLVREPARTGSGLSARTEKAPPLGEAMRFLWRLRTYPYLLLGTTHHSLAQYSLLSCSAPFSTPP